MLFNGGGDPFERLLAALAFGGGGTDYLDFTGYTNRTGSAYSYTYLDITGSGILLMSSAFGRAVSYCIELDGRPGFWIFPGEVATVPLFLPFRQSCKVTGDIQPDYQALVYALVGDPSSGISDMAYVSSFVESPRSYTLLDITGEGVLTGINPRAPGAGLRFWAAQADGAAQGPVGVCQMGSQFVTITMFPFKNRLTITGSSLFNLDAAYILK